MLINLGREKTEPTTAHYITNRKDMAVLCKKMHLMRTQLKQPISRSIPTRSHSSFGSRIVQETKEIVLERSITPVQPGGDTESSELTAADEKEDSPTPHVDFIPFFHVMSQAGEREASYRLAATVQKGYRKREWYIELNQKSASAVYGAWNRSLIGEDVVGEG